MPGKSCTRSLSWNGTQIPHDSLTNSLIGFISGSKSLGLASSSIPSAFYVTWDFIINFDTFFLGAFCWGSTESQCQQRPVNSSKSLSKKKTWHKGLDVWGEWLEQDLCGRASCCRCGYCIWGGVLTAKLIYFCLKNKSKQKSPTNNTLPVAVLVLCKGRYQYGYLS